jgi:hypothetical protein
VFSVLACWQCSVTTGCLSGGWGALSLSVCCGDLVMMMVACAHETSSRASSSPASCGGLMHANAGQLGTHLHYLPTYAQLEGLLRRRAGGCSHTPRQVDRRRGASIIAAVLTELQPLSRSLTSRHTTPTPPQPPLPCAHMQN